MENVILSELCSVLDTSVLDLDLRESFIHNGGHSLAAAAFASSCKRLGYDVTSRAILTSVSIREIINLVKQDSVKSTVPLKASLTQLHHNDEQVPPKPIAVTRSETEAPPDQVLSLLESSDDSSHSEGESSQTATEASSTSSPPVLPTTGPETASLEESPYLEKDNCDEELTSIQLSLVHGTLKQRGMNIVSYAETYFTQDIPAIKRAWKTVIDMEPIFQSPTLNQFRERDWQKFSWTEEPSMFTQQELAKATEKLRHQGIIGSAFHVFHHGSSDEHKDARSTVVWVVHHAFVDGFSTSLLLHKVRKVTAGKKIAQSPSFSQFCAKLVDYRKLHREEGNEYWNRNKEALDNATSHLLLPGAAHNPQDYPCDEVIIDLQSLHNAIQVFSRQSNVTAAALFNSAWAIVLSRYSDAESVKFGVVLSGRDLPLADVTHVVGPLMNTIPLCVTVNPELTIKTFVHTTMKALAEAGEYQWTTPENGFRNDFESTIAVQFDQFPAPRGSIVPIGEVVPHQATEIPFSIMMERGRKMRCVFRRDRFRKADVAAVGECYRRTLQLLLQKDATVKDVLQGLLPLSARGTLLKYGNCLSDRTSKTSISQDLVTLFERSVRAVPDNLSIEQGGRSMTYRDLDIAASQLAKRLSQRVRPGDIVCVHSDRSINWIVAIYGILKAKATYCSLDSGLPAELRDSMFTNASAKAYILPHVAQRDLAPASSKCNIAVDEVLEELGDVADNIPGHREEPVPWAVAYLCYTSGSTGAPKGVACTHAGLVAFQSELEVRLHAKPGIKISQVMSPAFDGSIHEIFSTLCYGATLVLPLPDDPFGHLPLVDSALLTPSIARAVDPDDFHRLRYVYLVGEPVPQSVNDKWSKTKNLWNMYGPTEGTCGATITRLMPQKEVTIGGPNPTTRIYVLDSHMELVMPGMIGEIYLAGVQIAEGYVNLPEVNKERFLPDKVMGNGEKMYKTGDKGYWNEDGQIVCIGRNDRQVKLRGYRLDMNDLEIRVARAVPELQAIAITTQGDHLICMVSPASVDTVKVVSRMSSVLPSYAVPRHTVAVKALPTTRAGKIDYTAMSEIVVSKSTRKARVLSTATERAVATAFRAVLDLDKSSSSLTAHSNFLDLGGHSLQQLSVSLRLSKDLGVKIPLQLIIEHPTIEDLAKAIDSFAAYQPGPVISLPPLREHDVSAIEEDWLMRYQFDAGSSCFNVTFVSDFIPTLVDRERLTDAWNAVLAYHPLLRSRYITRLGKSPRRAYSDFPPRAERMTSFELWTEVNRPFQTCCAPPIRVAIAEDRLAVVLSHIVADYTTLAVLLREVSDLYARRIDTLPPSMNGLEAFFSREAAKPCYLDFWSSYLDGCEESPALFGRKMERKNYRGTSVISQLPTSTVSKILACVNSTSYTLQHLATAAVAVCLQQPEETETDMVVCTPHINRDTVEALETVGLFLQPLPIRVKYPPSSTKKETHGQQKEATEAVDDQKDPPPPPTTQPEPPSPPSPPKPFLDVLRESSQSALAHAVPWHQLLARLAISPTIFPNHPLSDVMVSFHDSRQATSLTISADGFEPCLVWSEGAKFKLMCEFTALPTGSVLLRLEYDPECVRQSEVGWLQESIPHVLELLAEGKEWEEVRGWVNERCWGEFGVRKEKEWFGTRLSKI